jgi:hypothetical protein
VTLARGLHVVDDWDGVEPELGRRVARAARGRGVTIAVAGRRAHDLSAFWKGPVALTATLEPLVAADRVRLFERLLRRLEVVGGLAAGELGGAPDDLPPSGFAIEGLARTRGLIRMVAVAPPT